MIDPNLVTTVSVGELPLEPITTESKIPHELSGILNHSTIAQFIELLAPLVGKMAYEAVTLIVDDEYITNNFDLTPGATMGLGVNLCEGFAIRNGNNGTDNADGRVDIAYGTTYSAIGAIGGSKDAVVVAHTHTVNQIKGYGPDQGADGFYDRSLNEAPYGISTDSTGVSGTDKNMQPYRVVLKIMKLP